MQNPLELLKEHDLRKTPGRIDVLNVFISEGFALTHRDLELEVGTKYDRVTLYRILGNFEEKGLIHRIFDESGLVKYGLCAEKCNADHHSDDHVHFHCESCGKTFCIDHFPVPKIVLPSNYNVKEVSILVKGICQSCQ